MRRLLMVTTVAATLRAFLLPFAQHYRERGWRVDAMARGVATDQECLSAFDSVWEVPVSRNPLDPRNLLIAARIIQDVVRREQYDIVHVHTPVAAFIVRYALRNMRETGRPKVVYTAHGFHFFRGGPLLSNTVFLLLERLGGKWTDHLVVINREDFEAATRHGIVPPCDLTYVPGIGVDTAKYSVESANCTQVETFRAEVGLSPEDHLFLMIAEFNPGKRHADALRAFSSLDNPAAHLAFAGVGQLMDSMKELARELGVEKRVHFLGFRKDVPVLLRAATALILPSAREGLPRSIMEAQCLKVPVIGTDIRGVRDMLEDGAGVLVPVGDHGEIARAMQLLMNEPEQAQAIAERGFRASHRWDLTNAIAVHDDIYDRLLGPGSQHGGTPQ